MTYLLTTPRLGLRRWQPADLDPFTAMNADKAVREFFPSLMTRDETAQSIKRLEAHFDQYGYTFYALDVLETAYSVQEIFRIWCEIGYLPLTFRNRSP